MLRNKWEKLKEMLVECRGDAGKIRVRAIYQQIYMFSHFISFKGDETRNGKSDNRMMQRERWVRDESYPFFLQTRLSIVITQTCDKETHLLSVLSIAYAMLFFKKKKEEKNKKKKYSASCHQVTYMYDVTWIRKKKEPVLTLYRIENAGNTCPSRVTHAHTDTQASSTHKRSPRMSDE